MTTEGADKVGVWGDVGKSHKHNIHFKYTANLIRLLQSCKAVSPGEGGEYCIQGS